MDTIIAIGGTGARVLRSLIHVWALDSENSRHELIPILIDTDEGCGSARDVYDLTNAYNRVKEKIVISDRSLCYFKHSIKNPRSLYLKDLIGVSFGKSFIDYIYHLGGDIFQEKEGDNNPYKDFMSLFYSEHEKNIEINQGFYGNPKVGSLVFSNINFNNTNAQDYSKNNLYNELSTSDTITIVGSLHGGTGATGIMPVLKSLLSDAITSKKKINLFLVEPYYDIASSDTHTIQSKSFKPKAEASKQLFLRDEEIRAKLNSIYIISGNLEDGKDNYKYAEKGQNNSAHWIELVAARAIFHELFREKSSDEKVVNIKRFHTHHRENNNLDDRRNIDFRNIKPESDRFWTKLAGFSLMMLYLRKEYLQLFEGNDHKRLNLTDFPSFVDSLVVNGEFIRQPRDLADFAKLFEKFLREIDESGLKLFDFGILNTPRDNRRWGFFLLGQNEIREAGLFNRLLNLESRIHQKLRLYRQDEVKDRPLQTLMRASAEAMNELFEKNINRIDFFRH
jgi:hypothetical protein